MNDIGELAKALGAACAAAGLKVVTAESCTGGGVGEAITRVPGSSGWYDRGFVTYSDHAKAEILGVKAETLGNHGAVSEAAAREMAKGALQQSDADIAVAVTGVAGPDGGSTAKPVGLVWFAWARLDGHAEARFEIFGGDRAAIRAQAVAEALRGLARLAGGAPVADSGGTSH